MKRLVYSSRRSAVPSEEAFVLWLCTTFCYIRQQVLVCSMLTSPQTHNWLKSRYHLIFLTLFSFSHLIFSCFMWYLNSAIPSSPYSLYMDTCLEFLMVDHLHISINWGCSSWPALSHWSGKCLLLRRICDIIIGMEGTLKRRITGLFLTVGKQTDQCSRPKESTHFNT